MSERRVIVALDYDRADAALAFADRVEPQRCRLKVGKQLFTREGPGLVRRLVDRGFDVFLDLKYHDIPNTVANACSAAAELGVWMLNVHALGGRRMLEAAAESLQSSAERPLVIAVTVLTSMGADDLAEVGLSGEPLENVLRLAGLAEQAGLDGVVCSPLEIQALRSAAGPDFALVTPGIRPAGADTGDQRRVMPPGQALRQGASYLVIGRPITGAADPMAALAAIEGDIAQATTPL